MQSQLDGCGLSQQHGDENDHQVHDGKLIQLSGLRLRSPSGRRFERQRQFFPFLLLGFGFLRHILLLTAPV